MDVQPRPNWKGTTAAYLLSMFTEPTHRGQGHGAHIVREAIRFGKGARHPRDAPPQFGLRRAHLHKSRFRTNNGNAIVPGTRKTSPWKRSRLPEIGATGAMTIRSARARKPSNTTLIYEARTRRVVPMTTAYDVPPVLLIERIKEKLQAEGKIKPPEWAP